MRRRALFFAACVICLALCLVLPVSAKETEEKLFSDFFSALPPETQAALDGIKDPNAAAELVGAEHIASLVLGALRDGLSASGEFFLKTLGLALLLAILSQFTAELKDAGALAAAEIGTGVILALSVYRLAAGDMARLEACLSDMESFSNGLVPVFFGLYAAGGSTATATASAAGFTAFSYLLGRFCVAVLLPLFRLLFGLSVIGVVGGRLQIDGLFSTLKHTYVTVLCFLSLLLVTSLGFQSALASSADSLATQSVRFALGNMIPVIGGQLGGTLRTLSASLGLLKNTVGALSVAALLLLLLPTLVSFLLHRFFLSLSASFSKMLGAGRAEKVFLSFRGMYDLAVATLALTLVTFLLLFSLLVRCGVAVSAV